MHKMHILNISFYNESTGLNKYFCTNIQMYYTQPIWVSFKFAGRSFLSLPLLSIIFLCRPVVTSSNRFIPQYEADELSAFNSALEAYVRLMSAVAQLFSAEK
jgi:hypothetical protein